METVFEQLPMSAMTLATAVILLYVGLRIERRNKAEVGGAAFAVALGELKTLKH